MRLVLLILLLTIPSMAFADTGTVMQIVGYVMVVTGNPWGYALIVGGSVYSADQMKKRAAQQAEDARNARNSALQDRTATIVSGDAPACYVYGRARVGSNIVAMFTSGVRDEFKHLVCVHAAHECDAIEEVYIAGKALGTLDGSGYVTGGDYYVSSTASQTAEGFTGTGYTLLYTPIAGSVRVTHQVRVYDPSAGDGSGGYYYDEQAVDFTISGSVISGLTSDSYRVYYEKTEQTAHVRVLKHLGTSGEAADATLMAEVPTLWTANSKLSGYCYTIITLNLNQPEFQGGVPAIEVLLRGKKLYDPRDMSTIWNSNPALAAYDYLTSSMCQIPAADINEAYLISAANVCDETNTHGSTRYTCNGAVFSNQAQAKVLDQFAQCMAGTIVSTTWEMIAGKYTAPVLALDQSDIIGTFALTPGASDADIFNGINGRFYSSDNSYVMTDYSPYQDAVYLAADGRDLFINMDLPFTDNVQGAHNLCMIFTEDSRNGYTLRADFSLKAWDVRVGERVTLTSTVFGWTDKVFRVQHKQFSVMKGITLTLKEDAASIWDEAPAVTVDATLNTNLPDPFMIDPPGAVQTPVETLYRTTGSAGVKNKAIITWTAPASGAVDYELEYKKFASGTWIEIPSIQATSYTFYDIAPGKYDFRVKARNALNAFSQYSEITSFTIYGLSEPPSSVLNFEVVPFNGMASARWSLSYDLDVRIGGRIQIRFSPLTTGAVFANGTIMQELNGDATTVMLPLATGTYMAKFIDSTGNFSAAEASFSVTESLITGWTTTVTSTQHSTFTGTKTDCALSGALLIMSGTALTATYAYSANIDCGAGSTGVHRWHSHIKFTAYVASDLIDSRPLIDTWDSVDTTTIADRCDAWQEIRVSADASTWSSWMRFNVADLTGRYAQVRTQMIRDDASTYNIEISELSTTAKVTP